MTSFLEMWEILTFPDLQHSTCLALYIEDKDRPRAERYQMYALLVAINQCHSVSYTLLYPYYDRIQRDELYRFLFREILLPFRQDVWR